MRDPSEIAPRMKELGLTQAKVAKLLGISQPAVHLVTKGQRKLSAAEGDKLFSLLWPGDEVDIVPVVGFVGAGGSVEFLDDHANGADHYTVESLPGMGSRMVGLEVRGDSMLPLFREGYVAFIRRDFDMVEEAALRDWAVVRLADGRTMLKQIRRSVEPGRYDLLSLNAGPIEGIELVWATPVRGWRTLTGD